MILEFRPDLYFLLLFFMLGCESKQKNIWDELTLVEPEEVSVVSFNKVPPITAPEGMVWVPSGKFNQGAIDSDQMARSNERPAHEVFVDGFFMDVHEVTNAQFAKFVEDTGYVTMAEREIDWEEMKKQLPKGTLKPHDSILKPGSLVFKKTKTSIPNLYDYSQWWEWRIGANWKHPDGPDSDIVGKEDHPVVHIAFEDAMSYCSWAGKRLPTEAEWEYAARGGCEQTIFFWGNDLGQLSSFVNSWEGEFPLNNSRTDGYEKRAPVMSYPKNGFGLYDMAGNVWEWTQDWYDTDYYSKLQEKQEIIKNPNGASQPFNASNPLAKEKVIKGGSFLCSDSYCASYRISARMASSPDSSMEHLGFRTVLSSDKKNKR
ncbi:formylglycine-generating enzyme family protein [Flagellimonas oceanensis]|jgi:formylglycine-generating enzyme required for sulfatase activity|uniref:formylglycine-generating enzyme family protein n=2 Tax=Flagellimonas TaxID=444459 RepID=UPI003BAD9E9E